jgi:predicted ATPase
LILCLILTIENVSIIKQAKIALNGLTVIAGENDTGKSTVGKLKDNEYQL